MLQIPAFKAGNFTLLPIDKTDLAFVFEGLSDPEVIRYYGVSFSSIEACEEQLAFYERMVKEETGAPWKIVDPESGQAMGVVAGYSYQPQHERIEIGFWLLKRYQGKGVLKEVMPAFLQELKTLFKLHRIEALVESENSASCKLLKATGFTEEGLLRDYEIKNGKRISLFVYSILLDNSHQ